MKKLNIVCYMLIIIITLTGCVTKEKSEVEGNGKINIGVSIVPQETFVRAVGEDLVDVVTMIPKGHSPANYQPTPKQMIKFSELDIYFSIGVATEEANISPRIDELDSDMKVVSMNEKVKVFYPEIMMNEEEHSGRDPHIWLSPKRVKVMIECIKDELIKISPNNKDIFETNALDYIAQLDKVDLEIKELLQNKTIKSFIIYHPSFGYFAKEYGLDMITIEEGGKKTTAKSIEKVINKAKAENIRVVFYQDEFDSGQAEIIAKEIGGVIVKVSPLDGDYISNLKSIAIKLKEALR